MDLGFGPDRGRLRQLPVADPAAPPVTFFRLVVSAISQLLHHRLIRFPLDDRPALEGDNFAHVRSLLMLRSFQLPPVLELNRPVVAVAAVRLAQWLDDDALDGLGIRWLDRQRPAIAALKEPVCSHDTGTVRHLFSSHGLGKEVDGLMPIAASIGP
jgi:hypothetical protein